MGESPSLHAGARAYPGWRERLGWLAAGVLALIALALGVAYVRRPAMQTPATTMRLSVNPPEGATTFEWPVISPDGQMLAFVARTTGTRQIWVRRMDSPTARPLDGTENATQMLWSPDSQSLAFSAGGKLRKIALAGGAPVVLYDQPVQGGSWNQEGVILFSAGGAGLKRMDANGGNVADVTTIDAAQGESAHFSPVFLPDGRHFLFYVQHNEPAKRGFYVRALEGGQARQVLNTELLTIRAAVNPAAPGEGG
jgi:Tol biopolymer transport system component